MYNAGIAYLCWCLCFVGFCGIHRFYLGRPWTGLLWLFTFGLFFVGQFIDLFLIPGMVDRLNMQQAMKMGRGGFPAEPR